MYQPIVVSLVSRQLTSKAPGSDEINNVQTRRQNIYRRTNFCKINLKKMGVIGSKCKSKVDVTDIGEYVKYERLNNAPDDDHGKNKEARERKKVHSESIELRNDSSWDAVYTGVRHTGECKHSKSLSLTTQVSPKSPKSTATTDGDDVQSVSTLTSMLENPLLKRVKPDNPLYKRADGELRPVGPVHPWKLGKDKNQVRLELEEKGLIKTKTAEEEIIGNLRNVGIIRHDTINDNMGVTNELTRRLPARLAHLPIDTAAQTVLSDEKLAGKPKLNSDVVFSKSESGTGVTSLHQAIKGKEGKVSSVDSVSSDEKEEKRAGASNSSKEISEQKSADVIGLKMKILDTEIL